MAKGIWGNRGKKCALCGGDGFSRIGRKGEMFCVKCYRRIKKYGYFKRGLKDKNELVEDGLVVKIFIYNKKGDKIGECLIDKEFIDKVRKFKWGKDGRGYINTKKNGKSIKIHQLLLGKKEGFVIDHINGNKLDNRIKNLRHITHQQNIWNNHKAKGYYFDKRRKKFVVRICRDYKSEYFGGFKEEREAKDLVNKLRNKYFGEYAKAKKI